MPIFPIEDSIQISHYWQDETSINLVHVELCLQIKTGIILPIIGQVAGNKTRIAS